MPDNNNKYGLLMIHGAGLGSWIWDDVASRLKYPFLAVNLPKRDEPVETRSHLTLLDYVDDVLQKISAWEVYKIIVVAHSLGGVIGLEVADKLQDRLAGFVAVCASIPRPGKSFVSALPFPQKLIMPVILRKVGTQPPNSAIQTGLCNDLTEEQTERVIENYNAESLAIYTDKATYSPFNAPSLYIRTTQDKEYKAEFQKKLAANLAEPKIEDVDTGHLPMLSKPAQLSSLLNDFVDKNIVK